MSFKLTQNLEAIKEKTDRSYLGEFTGDLLLRRILRIPFRL